MATDAAFVEQEPALFEASVRVAIAPMHAAPWVTSQMISQQLAGHRVEVVDIQGDWARARGADGYDGWMHHGFLTEVSRNGGDNDLAPVSLGCVTADGADGRRALPLRARLDVRERVESGDVIDAANVELRFPLDAQAITESAKRFFRGTSYLWGGVTPWGADCSGLVQSVFALHGKQLPRDAWQQGESGADAGQDMAALRTADLLFFSDREDHRATHVGIALGPNRMVHLALGRGGYGIERLDDLRDPYVVKLRERFLFARRVLHER